MSKKIDNNMKLRNELNNLNNFLYTIYGSYAKNEAQREYFLKLFYTLSFTNKTRTMVEREYSSIENEELRDYYVNSYTTKFTLLGLVVINDLYIKLSHDFVTGRLTKSNDKLFNMIVKAMNKKDTTLLLGDAKYISDFIEAACSFIIASAYEKIALMSSLDEDDIKILSDFNPFFKEEYDHYNVTLDTDFFIRQISKWLSGEKKLNVALEKTAEFIIDMSYADPDKIDDFIDTLSVLTDTPSKLEEAIADGNIEVIKPIINKFYIDTLAEFTDSPSKIEEAITNGDMKFIKTILDKFYEERKEKTLKR